MVVKTKINSGIDTVTYIVSTRDISQKNLEKMLEESKMSGGEIMPTLAQRWLEEGKELGIKLGEKSGIARGQKQGKIETAKEALKQGIPIEMVAKITNLPIKEIKALSKEKH